MKDAIEELERKKSLQKTKKSNGQGSTSSSQKASVHKAPVSDTAVCDLQEAASCSHSDIAGQKMVDSKAPPLHAASQSAPPEPRPSQLPPSSQPACEVKEVKSSLSQTEERASNKEADKYPKENASDLYKEITVNKNLDQADQNNNLKKNGDANISNTVPKKKPPVQNEPVLKKAKRHVTLDRKKLKRTKGKKSSKPKEGCASGGGLRAGTIMSKTQQIQDKAVRKRAKSDVPAGLEESSNQEEEDNASRSTPGLAPSVSVSLSNGETCSIPSVEASPSTNDAPLNQEERTPDTTDPEASTPGEAAASQTVAHSAVPEESIVVKDDESSSSTQKNQHENEVFI